MELELGILSIGNGTKMKNFEKGTQEGILEKGKKGLVKMF
jgi:hypothetical protein